MKFRLSTFTNVSDTRPARVVRTWAQLCNAFANPKVRAVKDGLLFSPAIYQGNRRLQRDVIELSLLVLEVDGAWKCDGCGYKAPLVLFRNAKHEGDRCPECKKRDKKLLTSAISQIHFELPDLISDVRQAVHSAFAVYSSHSHKRVTYNAQVAEPRFRIVVPLSEPIPVARFRELWDWAASSFQTIPIDPQDKDPNRPWFTPVKSSANAIYEYHIEPGEVLDWRKVLDGEPRPTNHAASVNAFDYGPPTPFDSMWDSHEARHEELCNRIIARGKLNSQGNWDAKCLAHGGRGNTALCYFPRTGAVKCNRGCDYLGRGGILDAEGLSYGPLPTRDRLVARGTVKSGSELPHGPLPTVSVAKLHAIYGLLLAHFFVLIAKDETDIRREWRVNPYGTELVAWPANGGDYTPPREANNGRSVAEIKHCSMPSLIEQATACRELVKLGFDLRGVPGFYLIDPRAVPGEPTQASQVDRWSADEFGPWRLHLPYRKGLLVGYTNGTGYLLGIKIYRSVKDRNPVLLTSRGLPGGTRAVALKESVAA
jgi:hypothetical protein